MRAKVEIASLQAKMANGQLPEDEPLFCLRARDSLAADCVRYWAVACRKLGGVPEAKIATAIQLADTMDEWPVKQKPGRRIRNLATHTLLTSTDCSCGGRIHCNICDGGLAYCVECHGGERELEENSCEERKAIAEAGKDLV